MKTLTQTIWEMAERSAPLTADDSVFHSALVPIDLSDISLKALDYALALGARANADVHLLHVVEPTPLMAKLGDASVMLEDSAVATRSAKMLAHLINEHAGASVSIISEVRTGNPAHEIVQTADEKGCDLVILTTHGHTGLRRVLLGSTAKQVIQHAHCPVLVVRKCENDFAKPSSGPTPDLDLHKILVTTDLSPESIRAVRYAGRFARQFGGEIVLLHCAHITEGPPVSYPTTDPAEIFAIWHGGMTKELNDILQACVPPEVTAKTEIRLGPPVKKIAAFAEEGKFDLIICGTHGRTGLKDILLGSTAEGIVNRAPCPVLVVREPKS